jgi:hypothetical protein
MKTKKSLWIAAPLLLLWSCADIVTDPKPFAWETSFDFPITTQSVVVDSLLDDPMLQRDMINYNGELFDGYIYRDTIAIDKVEVGDQFTVDDMEPQRFVQAVDDVSIEGASESFTQKFDEVNIEPISELQRSEIGVIRLNDPPAEETDPVLLSEILDLSQYPEDATVTIPQGTEVPKVYRNVEFDDFSDALFSNGYLDMTVNNDMAMELGAPIAIRLLDTDSLILHSAAGDSAKAEWTVGVMPGTSSTERIDLAGITLPGEIIVEITSVLCGSGPQDVINNDATRNSSFTIGIDARELEVESAQAVVPEQIIDQSDVIELGESEHKVVWAEIANGTMAININNQMAVPSQLTIKIPSIGNDDSYVDTFTQVIDLQPFTPSENSYPLSDQFIRIKELDNQVVEYSYQIKTIDTSPEKVQVSATDFAEVEILLYGENSGESLSFKRFRGIVNQEPMLDAGEIEFETDNTITEAVISEGELIINVGNGINTFAEAAPTLDLEVPEIVDPAGQPLKLSLLLDPTQNPLIESVNLENYRLRPIVVDKSVQKMTYNSIVTIPENVVGQYNLLDSLVLAIDIEELKFNEVTGYFAQEAMTDSNRIDLDTDLEIQNALVESGELFLRVRNYVGIQARVTFKVEDIYNPSGQPLRQSIELDGSDTPVEVTISLNDYNIRPLTVDGKQQIRYNSRIAIPSDEEMTLHLEDSIAVRVEMRELSFKEVTGKVDSIIVDIDPTEQEIDAFPEEMNNLSFSQVDMSMLLNTEIDIPLYLDVKIRGYNDDGDSVLLAINEQLIPNEPLIIDDAEALLNIHPTRIIASGRAIADGQGTIRKSDAVEGNLFIGVPMIFKLSEPVALDLEPQKSSAVDGIPDELVSANIVAKVTSTFDFGVKVDVIAALDSAWFDGSGKLDTIARLDITANDTSTQYLDFSKDIISLFKDDIFIKTDLELNSGGGDAKLLPSDSLNVRLYGTVRALVDPNKEEE